MLYILCLAIDNNILYQSYIFVFIFFSLYCIHIFVFPFILIVLALKSLTGLSTSPYFLPLTTLKSRAYFQSKFLSYWWKHQVIGGLGFWISTKTANLSYEEFSITIVTKSPVIYTFTYPVHSLRVSLVGVSSQKHVGHD